MTRIFCQVLHRADRITFLWSEGAASFDASQSFEPYHLERGRSGPVFCKSLTKFTPRQQRARQQTWPTAGHQLYRAVFRRDSSDYGSAEAVRTWLTKTMAGDAAEKIEFLSDVPGQIPFNLLLDELPAGKDNPRYWGARFSMATGRARQCRSGRIRRRSTRRSFVPPTPRTALWATSCIPRQRWLMLWPKGLPTSSC